MTTIYRGIGARHRDSFFVPSALRHAELEYMQRYVEEHLSETARLLFAKRFRECRNAYTVPQYADVSDHAVAAYFLNIIHLSLSLRSNESIKLMQPEKEITGIENFRTLSELEDSILVENAFQHIDGFFITPQSNFFRKTGEFVNIEPIKNGLQLSQRIDYYSLFQHLNYTLKHYPYYFFPTMVLDWTDDLDVAKRFAYSATGKGVICSLDYDCYANFFNTIFEHLGFPMGTQIVSGKTANGEKFIGLSDQIASTQIQEMEKVVWATSHYNKLYSAYNNQSMRDQKGYTLFWLWEYTIDELLKNEIGKKLVFKVHLDCK